MKQVNISAVHRILLKEFEKHKAPIVDLIKIQTKNPFNVLVATILSARTNDRTTAEACRKLFEKVKGIGDLEKISINELKQLIYPVGFYHTKARHLKMLPKALKEFGGKVPDSIDSLLKLPGVGRKTANLVLAVGFEKPAICVDTHVHRITNRLGYVKTKTPFETEMALRKILPKKYWLTINSILVSHGQNTCVPISPFCSMCKVRPYCNRVGVKQSR